MSELYYTDERGTPLRPPRWWIGYLTGALLLLLGVACPCGGLILIVGTRDRDNGVSAMPGSEMHIAVDKPHAMVVWVQEPAKPFDGGKPTVPEDLHISVTGPDGAPVMFRSPPEETTSFIRGSRRLAIGFFDAAAAGKYSVVVTGTFGAQQSGAVSPDQTGQVAAMGLGAMLAVLLGALTVIGGLITLIVTTVRHVKRPRAAA